MIPPPITFDSILEGIKDLQQANCSEQPEDNAAPPKPDKEDFWSMLLLSARRRKSTASAGETPLVHSPLISNPMTVDNNAALASVNCEVSPPAPIFSWNNASRSSLEITSFERISYDPLAPLKSDLPAAQLGPVEANLDSLVEGPSLESHGHLSCSCRPSTPEPRARKKRNLGESYVERLRLSSMHHLARSKTV